MKCSHLAFCVLVLGIAGCKPAKQAEPSAPSQVAPSVEAPKAVPSLLVSAYGTGNPVTLSARPDRQQLVVFFAPWADSGPAVVEWINNFQASGVEIIPAVVDRRSAAERAADASIGGLNGIPYLADETLIKTAGGIRALPSAVLFKEGLTVAGTWQGLPTFTGVVAAVSAGAASL